MANFDHFNIIGPIYDYVFGRNRDHKIVALAEVQQSHSVLDVGGGTGRVTMLFRPITDKIVIADTAVRMLREAQSKGVRGVNAESEQLPFLSQTFDRIIMVDALHHVQDQQKTLEEMWRVLAPGGMMIVEEPDIRKLVVKLIALAEKVLLMRSHFLSPEKIAEMCHSISGAEAEIVREGGNAWIMIERKKCTVRAGDLNG